MDGVAERRNRTLKEIVRNMISHSILLEPLLGEALRLQYASLKIQGFKFYDTTIETILNQEMSSSLRMSSLQGEI